MAPEQIVAEWRNWGSWTDLYALGVIAYEFASGHLPFIADNWIAVGQLHLQAPPPAFEPIFPMPDQFLQWDLNNHNELPVASGIYIAHIEMPEIGKSRVLKVAIIQEQQFLENY